MHGRQGNAPKARKDVHHGARMHHGRQHVTTAPGRTTVRQGCATATSTSPRRQDAPRPTARHHGARTHHGAPGMRHGHQHVTTVRQGCATATSTSPRRQGCTTAASTSPRRQDAPRCARDAPRPPARHHGARDAPRPPARHHGARDAPRPPARHQMKNGTVSRAVVVKDRKYASPSHFSPDA